jgi:UDP-N-acetylmuramoyl-tripeptide--D-alanyl-D-alanine ligase
VFPFGDAFTPLWQAMAREGATRRSLTFGEDAGADISLLSAEWRQGAWQFAARTPVGEVRCVLRIAGRHNVINALAAIACSLASGVPPEKIAEGLAAFEPVKGRSRAVELRLADGRAVTLVDDTYNANPDSMRAAIEVLASLPGPRVLVLGDMGEVGMQGPEFHAEIGAWARERGIETVYALGQESAHSVAAYSAAGPGGDARHFEDIDALNAAVLAQLPRTASMLVKGSRFMQMERVVQAVTAAAPPQQRDREAGHAA